MQKKNIFPLFAGSMVMFHIAYSTVRNYATFFLQTQNYTNTEIGVFYSLGALLSIISQYGFGSLLDKHERITAKHVLIGVTCVVVIDAAMLIFSHARWLIFAGFTVINMIMLLDKSLYNIFGLSYVNAGYDLDFSLARGVGSVSTTLFTLATGVMIERFSERYIFFLVFVVQALFLVGLRMLPYVYRSEHLDSKPDESLDGSQGGEAKEPTHPSSEAEQRDERALLPSNREFSHSISLTDKSLWILLVSILLIYSCYNAGNNYHINIIKALGGGSRELGVSDAIMAAVEFPAMAAFLPLSKRFSYRDILCFSIGCFVLKVVCFAFATSMAQVYLAQILQLFSYGFFIPASAYYFNQILAEDTRGRGQSLLIIFTSGLSGLLTSPVIGLILDHFSVKTTLLMVASIACLGIVGSLASTKRLASKGFGLSDS